MKIALGSTYLSGYMFADCHIAWTFLMYINIPWSIIRIGLEICRRFVGRDALKVFASEAFIDNLESTALIQYGK